MSRSAVLITEVVDRTAAAEIPEIFSAHFERSAKVS